MPKITTSTNEPDGWQATPIYQLEIASAAAYADLISIWYDLHFVAEACALLSAELAKSDTDQDPIIVRGVWAAILATYARCFITGKRKPLPKSDIDLLPLEGNVIEWHQFLIDMRNKHIAHSVNGFEAVRIGVSLHPSSNEVDGIAHMNVHYVSTDRGGVEQTHRLAIELIKLLAPRIETQTEIVRQDANALGVEYISQLPTMGAVAPGVDEAGTARA